MKGAALGLVALLAIPAAASADEIRLKDGSKIIGTIVGFEGDSFKVQTSYGFAMVRKDKIAAIIPTEAKSEAKPAAKADVESKKDADVKKLSVPVTAANAVPPPRPKREMAPPAVAAVMPASQPVAAPAGQPPEPPAPPVIREEVQGNLYINHTYGFHMYKPPGWHVIEGAHKTLPTAIVAMGTSDETTLLVVGRETLKDSLEKQAAATEKQLREVYENYRRISEQRTKVAGLPALERRYRGTVDSHDWSGVIVSLARGNELFTVLGMTYADSDLIQIQENVIAKAIASLDFAKP